MAVCWQQGSPLAVRGGKAAAANSHPSVHGAGYESAHTYKSARSLHPPVRAMACAPVVFANPEFGKVRVVEVDGEPWIADKDVAAALGYSDTDQALRKHIDDEDKLTRQFNGSGQSRSATIINESGLYSLVLSSKLPGAKKFRRWVTSEVLPSIRKHGGYIAGQEQMSDGDEELSKQASCRKAGRYFCAPSTSSGQSSPSM